MSVGFSTWFLNRLPDFIGPIPSVTLDKDYSVISSKFIVTYEFLLVNYF